MNGRRFRPELEVLTRSVGDGRVEVRSPAVGYWRGAPAAGTVVQPGASLGELEVLDVCHGLVASAEARGVVVALGQESGRARLPVGWGDVLMVLDPAAAGPAPEDAAVEQGAATSAGLVLRAPSSGRFYSRPAPDKPPFVQPGDVIEGGHTIALLEVMKTFNRIQYGGGGLPERARVVRVVPENETDIDGGDVLLELEPA